jgi:hypothetical protein
MWTRFLLVPAVAVTALSAPVNAVVDDGPLQSKTLKAFEQYVAATEARMKAELDGRQPFLWVNRQSPAAKADAMARLSRGEVVPARMETSDNGKKISVDDGMIHHWIGSVLMPGVSLAKARAVVERYDQYPRVLDPMVQRARVLQHTGPDYVVQMRTSVTKFMVTVVIDADYKIAYTTISPSKLYTRSVAEKIHEVKSPGGADEYRIEGDKSGGFLWRLNTYCSFEELPAGTGTVEQCESVSLTRDIPLVARMLGVGALVNGLPRETLAYTLSRVRDEAVKAK